MVFFGLIDDFNDWRYRNPQDNIAPNAITVIPIALNLSMKCFISCHCSTKDGIDTELPAMPKLSRHGKRADSKGVMILIPGIHMYATSFIRLAQAIEKTTGLCVYGVELLSEEIPLDSVPNTALWIVTKILEQFPTDRIYIGGHSLGARIATEVVQLLECKNVQVEVTLLIDDGPTFKGHGFADTWDSLAENHIERVSKYCTGWFVSSSCARYSKISQAVVEGKYDLVAHHVQQCDKSDLNTTLASIATTQWNTNKSFRDRVWRLARFFHRIVQGDLLGYAPTSFCPVPVILTRTGNDQRADFLKGITQSIESVVDVEPMDFFCSTIFSKEVQTHVIDEVSHHSIVSAGAAEISLILNKWMVDHQ